MSEVDNIDWSRGALVKLFHIETEGSRIYFNRRDGGTGWFKHPQVTDAAPGDTYYLPDDIAGEVPVKLPSEYWPESTPDVGTVNSLSSSGDVAVIEVSGRHLAYPQRESSPYRVGQTLMMKLNGQPGAVLSDKPIDRLGLHRDEDFDPAALRTDPQSIEVDLDDFGGSPSLVRRASQLVRVALDPQGRLQAIGANPVKGILFSGPSGTGKTHLARALSRHTNASFYLIDGPEMVNKWVGESEKRLRALFEDAQKQAPSLLFFDELDSLVTSRGSDASEHSTRLIGQLLTALDGFRAGRQVLVIAATNLPGSLDSALLRPGRLGFKIQFDGQLSPSDRLDILRVSSRKVQGAHNCDLARLVLATEGWSPAEIASIWTESAILASLDERSQLSRSDIDYGLKLATHNRAISLKQVADQ
ncbi:ATP-binding protein [Quadrisphaera oryzae]|uniref:ATP-binding protein n=1 Tax=Quadrisphaera TaxID=317661 RepID=UPI0016478C93|nr:ATP-binding protein [Quadrisphaera sp. RL12-1S]MBC3762602.1 ATP-binding protein [Quadrisphaera sp. RL12-1S]